jgi:hypothetical protein
MCTNFPRNSGRVGLGYALSARLFQGAFIVLSALGSPFPKESKTASRNLITRDSTTQLLIFASVSRANQIAARKLGPAKRKEQCCQTAHPEAYLQARSSVLDTTIAYLRSCQSPEHPTLSSPPSASDPHPQIEPAINTHRVTRWAPV